MTSFACDIGMRFFSILVESFLFRPFVKARPELFLWNRELRWQSHRSTLLQGEVMVPGSSADAPYPAALLVHDQGQQEREAT